MMVNFLRGQRYSRADIREVAGLPRAAKGGNWDTGIIEHGGEFLIFANIGTEGRTGHIHANRWEGDRLRWYHKGGSHLLWPSVRRLVQPDRIIHVFWRSSNAAPFEYNGPATAVEIADTCPVEILWAFEPPVGPVTTQLVLSPEQLPLGIYREGAVAQALVNVYERDRAARQACIDLHGIACFVCGMCFEERYGAVGVGFIHIHHLRPLSEVSSNYEVDPADDLRPVCPNCHAMLHRRRPPLSIAELRAMLR